MSSERFNGVVDQTTTLQYLFTKNYQPFDAYEVTKVEIFPSLADAQADTNLIETIASGSITKTGTGIYQYVAAAIATAGTYVDKLTIVPESGMNDFVDYESFAIHEFAGVGDGETRRGYGFNNPDFTSNDNWGAIITPDELRYIYCFGNDLVAPNWQTITDETLKWYIDNAISAVERDLNITLFKRTYKARPHGSDTTRDDLSESGTPGINYEWDEPYDFDNKAMSEYLWIKLRHRPVISLEKIQWKDMTGGDVIDLMDWVRPNFEKGSLQFFPTGGTIASLPLSMGIGAGSYLFAKVTGGRGKYPDAFFVDYTCGFNNVKEMYVKWRELFHIVGMLASINLLNDYGDGRNPGLASSSVSLAGISESFSTTSSATNALFGARLIAYSKQIREFYKANKNKYAGVLLGSL